MKSFGYYVTLLLLVVLGIIDLIFAILFVGVLDKGAGVIFAVGLFLALFIYLTVKCRKYHNEYRAESSSKNADEEIPEKESFENEVDEESFYGDENKFVPDFEIKYQDAEGEFTTRKISVISFKDGMVKAYCFLRKEKRTFYIPRIVECIDLSTGELVFDDLRIYFLSKYSPRLKPPSVFNYDDWNAFNISNVPELPDSLNEFELGEKIKMEIILYNDGIIKDDFQCGKIYRSSFGDDKFYIQLLASNGKSFNTGFSKILKADGIENFGSYVLEKFCESDKGKAFNLVENYGGVLSIFIYLGRADSSLTASKRKIICDYMNLIGADCSDEVLAIASRKIKVDLPEFKKAVNDYSKYIEDGKKKDFVLAAASVVGGREKAKSFGLAGLQYIDSKFK